MLISHWSLLVKYYGPIFGWAKNAREVLRVIVWCLFFAGRAAVGELIKKIHHWSSLHPSFFPLCHTDISDISSGVCDLKHWGLNAENSRKHVKPLLLYYSFTHAAARWTEGSGHTCVDMNVEMYFKHHSKHVCAIMDVNSSSKWQVCYSYCSP